MRVSPTWGIAVGAALFIYLLTRQDLGQVLDLLAASGWGLAVLVGYRPATFVLDAIGWRVLMPKAGPRPGFGALLMGRWVAESCNTLLPMAQVGGHVVRARMIARSGIHMVRAGAVVLVDFTVGVFTQFAFTLAAALLLLPRAGDVGWSISGASLIFLLLVAGFALTQRAGMFSLGAGLLQRMLKGRRLAELAGNAQALDEEVRSVYRRRSALAVCAVWRLAGWVAKAGEAYLALYFLGAPVTLADALMLEALSTAAASAAFMVPGGLGVRDGSILLLAAVVGLDADTALALALLKRGREIVLGVPGLAAWAMSEGRSRG